MLGTWYASASCWSHPIPHPIDDPIPHPIPPPTPHPETRPALTELPPVISSPTQVSLGPFRDSPGNGNSNSRTEKLLRPWRSNNTRGGSTLRLGNGPDGIGSIARVYPASPRRDLGRWTGGDQWWRCRGGNWGCGRAGGGSGGGSAIVCGGGACAPSLEGRGLSFVGV